jgi:hypothetical protein
MAAAAMSVFDTDSSIRGRRTASNGEGFLLVVN